MNLTLNKMHCETLAEFSPGTTIDWWLFPAGRNCDIYFDHANCPKSFTAEESTVNWKSLIVMVIKFHCNLATQIMACHSNTQCYYLFSFSGCWCTEWRNGSQRNIISYSYPYDILYSNTFRFSPIGMSHFGEWPTQVWHLVQLSNFMSLIRTFRLLLSSWIKFKFYSFWRQFHSTTYFGPIYHPHFARDNVIYLVITDKSSLSL